MVYAQIRNNTIQNTFILKDPSLLQYFSCDNDGNPYDSILQVDNIYPQPGIGWTFDNITWNAPPSIAPDDGS